MLECQEDFHLESHSTCPAQGKKNSLQDTRRMSLLNYHAQSNKLKKHPLRHFGSLVNGRSCIPSVEKQQEFSHQAYQLSHWQTVEILQLGLLNLHSS